MMTGPRSQFDIAQLPQIPPHSCLRHGYSKLIMEPARQIDQPPAYNPMDRRNGAALNDVRKGATLGLIQQRTLARRLAVEQPIRTAGIEPDNPVPHDLQAYPANAGRIAPAPPS